jgi:SNF2 family DNA or RNA helicase
MTFSQWHVSIGLLLTHAILLDSDPCWVPSDGQKRSVYIYRFLTAGTIDGESL